MPVIRTSEERNALVAEAVLIDKTITGYLFLNENASTELSKVYADAGVGPRATELSSISAAERVQRIVSALIQEENMTSQSNEDLTTIATNTNTIAEKMTNIEDHLNALRLAGDPVSNGEGIRTRGAFGEFTLSVLYSLYIKQAQAIADPDASAADQAESLQKIQSIITEIQSTLGNGFD